MSLNESAPDPQSRHRLHALLKDFDRVLASEYEAVRTRDAERLQSAVDAKQRLTSDIEKLTPQIRPPAASPHNAGEHEEWAAIQRLLGRCALANRTNGAAIDASRSFMTSLLDLLSGRRISERTYTASGRLDSQAQRLRVERV